MSTVVSELTKQHGSEARTALETVTAQVDAFNAHDLEAFVATYAADALVTGVASGSIVGRDALREFYGTRFENLLLSCKIDTVVQFGESWIVAREYVHDGTDSTETIATFHVSDGLILKASMLKA